MSRWTALLPASWRRRHGVEIDELLRLSERPMRDRLDVVWLALRRSAVAVSADRTR